MIVRKLRLKRGWSQEQLAEMSGLSVRTIQRVERGQSAELETLKSLAAVFEIDFNELKPEAPVNTKSVNTESGLNDTTLTAEEKKALSQVRDIKGFYIHLGLYLLIMPVLLVINLVFRSEYLWVIGPALGWGVGLLSHGLNVFVELSVFSAAWEKRQVEKRLGRKL
ncbi:MAG: 2TM domain-containing protein [Pseudohongiella sp.]|uniref:2TM domain-containing protein n=1 Tax=Pseudohongiella sp. TaxID=1979412 RepID=UPI0034A02E96